MAATSHDFWLHNLSPRALEGAPHGRLLRLRVDRRSRRSGRVCSDTASGACRRDGPGDGLVALAARHRRGARARGDVEAARVDDGWIDAGPSRLSDEPRAYRLRGGSGSRSLRYGGKVSAVLERLPPPERPLGEGRVIDGCITCPWHGYQYLPENGRSPAPFTEKVETFRRPRGRRPRVREPEPACARHAGWSLPVSDEFFVGYLPMPRATARRMKRMAGAIVVLGASNCHRRLRSRRAASIARRTSMDTSGSGGERSNPPRPRPGRRGRTRVPTGRARKHGAAPSIAGNEGRAVRLEGQAHRAGRTTMIEVVPGTIERSVAGRRFPRPRRSRISAPRGCLGRSSILKCFLGVMNPGRLRFTGACANALYRRRHSTHAVHARRKGASCTCCSSTRVDSPSNDACFHWSHGL